MFRQLLEGATKHQFDIVLVHTIDRCPRNIRISLEAAAILEQNHIRLFSISEQLDRQTPEGRLSSNMLGGIAQCFSEILGKHVSKALNQRVFEGKHTGAIPFGCESSWIAGAKGEKTCRCNPEHKNGIHTNITEGQAATYLFQNYASANSTLDSLLVTLTIKVFVLVICINYYMPPVNLQ